MSLGPLMLACRVRRDVFYVEHLAVDARNAGSLFLDVATEEMQEGRRAGLVQNDLETARARRGAGFASRCRDERVLESRGGGAVVGLGLVKRKSQSAMLARALLCS